MIVLASTAVVGLSAGGWIAAHGRTAPNRHAAGPEAVEILHKTAPSVFVVKRFDRQGELVALGSAVQVQGGHLVTSEHVVSDAASLRVEQSGKVWPATIAGCDDRHDLCLLEAAGLRAPGVPLRLATPARAGETVYAIGAPEGVELVISAGLVSGLRTIRGESELVMTAPVSEGSSGGGVFDQRARLLGLTAAQISNGEDLNLAVPAEWIAALIAHAAAPNHRPSEKRLPTALRTLCVGSFGSSDEAPRTRELLVVSLFARATALTESCANADGEIRGQVEGLQLNAPAASNGSVTAARLALHLSDRSGAILWADNESFRGNPGQDGLQHVVARAVARLMASRLLAGMPSRP
ncbi:MAG TPA: serine protease [Terriglobales bacterium]|nr:serine protease [Terriglobales bacterium]